MSDLNWILVPQETVNDENYLLLDLPVAAESPVEEGKTVAVIQTSKTVFDIPGPTRGYFYSLCQPGDTVRPGTQLGFISSLPVETWREIITKETEVSELTNSSFKYDTSQVRFSQKASELAAKHGITPDDFSGLSLVRVKDVEGMLRNRQARDPEKPEPILNPKTTLLILGGGGLAKMIIDLVRQQNPDMDLVIVERDLPVGSRVMDVPVIGDDTPANLEEIRRQGVRRAALGVGAVRDLAVRNRLYMRLKDAGFEMPVLIHPRAIVESSATFGEGSVVLAGAIVGSEARIGNLAYINTGAIVSHDCVLEGNVHIAPGAILGGRVTVGSNTLVGMGSTIYFDARLGRNVRIRNGSHIFTHVPDNTVVR